MTLQQLKYAVVTAEKGTVSEAAASLYIAQPSLTKALKELEKEMGISILLNIHHVELAIEYADRIIGIRAGRIVYDGPSKQVDQAVLNAIYGDDAETEATA